MSDVWDCVPTHKRKETGHIAVMPEEIVNNILSSIEDVENKVVLDNFMGTGTTGKVCLKNYCKFIGIELDEGYFKIAQNGIENTYNELNKITI